LAEERDQEAARALAARKRAMEEAEQRLQDLLAYRGEYTRALADTGGPGLGIQVQEYLRFLARLNQAISDQQKSIDHHHSAVAVATQRRQDTQEQIAVLGKVAERAHVAECKDRARRDQRLTDEMAGAVRRRGQDGHR
jgi:flagellar FliJ protein